VSLLWFHATGRQAASDYVRLLDVGLRPAAFVTDTQQLELHLAIVPHRVYCYLGRTLEAFGEFCVALRPDSLPVGELSPFDTGGLVRKLEPIRTWTREQQQTYLDAFSFSTLTRADCLARHPAEALVEYLECARPVQRGPHQLWDGTPEADIWALAPEHDWRAWTWEGRWQQLPIAGQIVAWSCAPSLFPLILDATERTDANISSEILDGFLQTYQPGGVGALVADLKAVQAQ
jgi:hypothetical protein